MLGKEELKGSDLGQSIVDPIKTNQKEREIVKEARQEL